MTTATLQSAPVAPFDALASVYDELFTDSLIGRAQRDLVWRHIDGLWSKGDRVLELNCGTGEDALHLASRGIAVTACDVSSAMIEVARRRLHAEAPNASVEFKMVSNEHIGQVSFGRPFDGVLSNFSGLNCVRDLGTIAADLATLVRPGTPLALCMSTRFCLWELIWYALHGEFTKSTRRWSGHTQARVGDENLHVWYPTVRQLQQEFSPWFRLEKVVGIGTTVPPTYAEGWVRKHPSLFTLLRFIDRHIHQLPWIRALGDHMLLRFRRCPA